jgi:hypothetical protein
MTPISQFTCAKGYVFGQGIWDKMWPIGTIHGICSKTWGTGGEYIRNTILNIIWNK